MLLTYCRDAGAISSLVALLQPGVELPSDLLKAVLKVLLGLAHDELSCDAIQQASGIPRVIKLLEYAKDDQVRSSCSSACTQYYMQAATSCPNAYSSCAGRHIACRYHVRRGSGHTVFTERWATVRLLLHKPLDLNRHEGL